MTERPFMKLYCGDYSADTQHLTTEQHGAYLLLLMHYWTRGSLPSDEVELARIVKMSPAQWRKNRNVIAAFFSAGWKHKRMEHELTDWQRKSDAGRRAGVASALQRKGNETPTSRIQNP